MEHDDVERGSGNWLPQPPVDGSPTAPGQAPAAWTAPTPHSAAPQPPHPTQPYGAPGPYGPHGYYGQPPQPSTPTLAIVGLVLAFIVPPVGLILSVVALVRVRRGGVLAKGRGLAIGGVAVGLVLSLLTAAAVSVVVLEVRTRDEVRSAFTQTQDSLNDGDCDVYMARSTERFRAALGVETCDDFAAFVASSTGGSGFGVVPVTGVDVHGDTATLSTVENIAFGSGDAPEIHSFDYTLVRQDGVWRVDAAVLTD